MTINADAGPGATPDQARAAALRTVARMKGQATRANDHLEMAIGAAIALGCSLRQVADEAEVAHTTVQRIAARAQAAERGAG